MGRVFRRYLNDKNLYICNRCKTHIAKERDVMSKNFRGNNGVAYMFKRAYNVRATEISRRNFSTGAFLARDLICGGCGLVIGWEYEFAHEDSEKYKEERVVIEATMVSCEVQVSLQYRPDSDSDSAIEEDNGVAERFAVRETLGFSK